MSIVAEIDGRVYCGDPAYDNFTGHLVDRWGWVQRDSAGRPIRTQQGVLCRVREYVDIGRPADVQPVDPDAAMQRERLPVAEGQRVNPLQEGFEAWRTSQRQQRTDQLCALIDEHGPIPLRQAARLLGCTKATLQDAIKLDPRQRVIILGRDPRGNWLGYPGQFIPGGISDTPNYIQRAQAYLREYGPALLRDMARDIGADPDALRITIKRRPDMFAMIEPRRRLPGQAKLVILVGVHDGDDL